MSRVLKFRAWSKTENLMVPWLALCQNAFNRDGASILHKALCNPNYEPMQFTGLLDKNGVEVFEGDVVSIEVYDYAEPLVFPVRWNDKAVGFGINPDEERCDISTLTVLGNEFEHPHLLEGET